MSQQPRLQWWQEKQEEVQYHHPPAEQTAPSTVHAVVPDPLAEIAHASKIDDFEAELEAEAQRRTTALQSGERIEFYANRAQNIARYRKRLLLLSPLLALVFVANLALGIALHSPVNLIVSLIPLIEFVLLYKFSDRIYKEQDKPVFTLTDEGIEIYGLMTRIGLLKWDEIKEIKAYNWGYRYVGIVPKDTKGLCKRLDKGATFILRSNQAFRVPAISIAQVNLPLTADEFVKKVEEFRARRRV